MAHLNGNSGYTNTKFLAISVHITFWKVGSWSLYWVRETNGCFWNVVEDFFPPLKKKRLWIIILCLYLEKRVRRRENRNNVVILTTHLPREGWHKPCHLWKATLPSNQSAKEKLPRCFTHHSVTCPRHVFNKGWNEYLQETKTQTRNTSRTFWLWFEKQNKTKIKQNLFWKRRVVMRSDRRTHVPTLRVRGCPNSCAFSRSENTVCGFANTGSYPPLPLRLTLGKFLSLSGSWFPHLWNG